MYAARNFKKIDNETFEFKINPHKDFKILQLTDLHLGFGFLSRRKDKLALSAVSKIIKHTKPDMIVLTGDSIFPFIFKAGTMNNKRQANFLIHFMDSFKIPYTMVFGNHDSEIGAFCRKEKLAEIFASGKYSIFSKGNRQIGIGNFFINLTDKDNNVVMPLVMIDSNMYGKGGWFYSGFDCIHKDQTEWCMRNLNKLKRKNENIKAMAFFHIPVEEFKEAYEKMKLGDKSVIYKHGNIGEANEHFGIPRFKGDFFEKAVDNGIIKWMFCGHDHLNTLSLVYKGIQMTYGMSIDYLGYKGIEKRYTQRGGTLITRCADGEVNVKMIPLTSI